MEMDSAVEAGWCTQMAKARADPQLESFLGSPGNRILCLFEARVPHKQGLLIAMLGNPSYVMSCWRQPRRTGHGFF